MRTTNVTAVLATAGLHQRLYSEPTVVEELCGGHGAFCRYDADCCAGHHCDWDLGGTCWCDVC